MRYLSTNCTPLKHFKLKYNCINIYKVVLVLEDFHIIFAELDNE